MKNSSEPHLRQIPFVKSMRLKIALGILLIIGLILLLLGNVTIKEQRNHMLAQMKAYGQETARFIAQISVVPIQKFSIYQLESYAAQLEKGELISYCRIYDTEGNGLAHSTNHGKKPAPSPEETLIFSADIKDGDTALGRVEIGVNLAPVLERINTTSRYVAVAFWVELILIGFTVSFFIHKSLVSPIHRLARTTSEIASGRFIASRLDGREDELGLLAKTINAMSKRLEESYKTLELKVAERTAELATAKTHSEATAQNLKVVSTELQALLDNSPVAILFVTTERIIKRVNKEFSNIFGFTQDEVVGASTRILYRNDKEFREASNVTYNILRRVNFCQTTLEMRKKNGTKITCSLRGRKTVLEDNSEGVIWSIEDISSRLKMEEELLKVKKLESIGVLAGGIAHDFNNILVAIIGNVSLAERLIEGNEKVAELLRNSKNASLRAKDLTVKLLTFSKGGDPIKSIERLPDIVRDSASFILSGSNVKCDYDIEDDLWAVPMDKGQINQVIQNLILNADQSMPKGGTIHITCRNVSLAEDDAVELQAGNYVKLSIADSGKGIDPLQLDNIFDPYFSTKEKSSNKGSGLGLSIVHSIIKKHDGSVQVDSEPGKGTVFTLFLPATDAAPGAQLNSTPILPEGKGVVLLMDDDATIHEVGEEMLTYLGYSTLHAYSGEEAIELYRQHLEGTQSIDIVILDLTIPGAMGGDVAVGKILEIDPEAKVIVSSGYSDDPILQNYRQAGFANIISKPYQLLDLSKVLNQTLQD